MPFPPSSRVNYAVLDDDIVFRTRPGTKLNAALSDAVVAFEIDQTDPRDHSGWSVVVIGVARPITDDATLARAGALALMPWADGSTTPSYGSKPGW